METKPKPTFAQKYPALKDVLSFLCFVGAVALGTFILNSFVFRSYNVVGVSKDSVKSHAGFRSKYDLPFTLLADTTTQMLQDFGAWGEKKLYGKVSMGTLRRTFIFDENGILERIIEKVDTKNAATQILDTK